MPTVIEGGGAAAELRFAIVRSRFNEEVTKRLLAGALDALRKGGARDEAIDVVCVPGAFEIPLVASRLARSRRYGGYASSNVERGDEARLLRPCAIDEGVRWHRGPLRLIRLP